MGTGEREKGRGVRSGPRWSEGNGFAVNLATRTNLVRCSSTCTKLDMRLHMPFERCMLHPYYTK